MSEYRCKLRSSCKNPVAKRQAEPKAGPSTRKGSRDDDQPPDDKRARVESIICRRKLNRLQNRHSPRNCKKCPKTGEPLNTNAYANILHLNIDVVLHIVQYLDGCEMIKLYRSCKHFYNMLRHSPTWWKTLVHREEMQSYEHLGENQTEEDLKKIGWAGKPMQVKVPDDYEKWRKVYLRCLQMRRNIVASNFEGWRIYANTRKPVVKLTPDLDLNEVKQEMGEFAKLSVNDDLKIDWDDKKLVVFHFFRNEGETCTIQVWDIENEPRYEYAIDKGIDYITDKVFVHDGHIVVVPSWPLSAQAVVMTLSIENQMAEVGRFLFADEEDRFAIDELWDHTQLRVVKDKAMVVCRCPNWRCVVVDLPYCNLLCNISLEDIGGLYECQQIRSYRETAIILFAHKSQESSNTIATVDVLDNSIKLRSMYDCKDVVDVALFTDPEEIYLVKKNGDVVTYDATKKTELMKIKNPINNAANAAGHMSEYQLFVNRKEQICVMQSASEVSNGRRIDVYSSLPEASDACKKMYDINLDLCKYNMSRDESICIYTNGAFLAAADSKKFALFNVKNGKYLGQINIPAHLERSKGKDEKHCMFEQTGLSLFIFDEDKLIAVHDYERSFPAVLDIYKFW